jgi:hypothetical protein
VKKERNQYGYTVCGNPKSDRDLRLECLGDVEFSANARTILAFLFPSLILESTKRSRDRNASEKGRSHSRTIAVAVSVCHWSFS